ncbi:hypothetical protein V8E55_005714 [Tylopilus felleus]
MANPHYDECPDYMLPEFKEAHLLFTVEGKSNQEAADFSNTKAIKAWDQQCTQEIEAQQEDHKRKEQEEERQCLLREQEEQAMQEERKKYKNKLAPIPDKPLPPTSLLLPLQHALNKLHKGDYVLLYFFTNKGIREAEDDSSGDKDLLTLIQTDKGPTFQTAASAKAKKHKVKDEHLSWEEFGQANYQMITAMKQQEWLTERVNMTHAWRHDTSEYCKKVLLLYEGKLHQELLNNAYAAKIDAVSTVCMILLSLITQANNTVLFPLLTPSLPLFPFSSTLIPAPYAGVSPPM